MTPEQKVQHEEMYADFQARQVQQIRYPLDEASKNSLGVVTEEGLGSGSLTQSVAIATIPTTFISVPAAYAGYVIFEAGGVKYVIPYTATI